HVGRWEDCDRLVASAYDAFGKVDILVNNAGSSPLYASLPEVTEELFDKVVAVNLKGAFRLCSLVGTRMAEDGGGSIINVSSVNAIMPGLFLTDISKAWDPAVLSDHLEREVALHRGGVPEEIVGAALYLASAASSYTTGAVIKVDGGMAWALG
ncbi:MAG: SDR family NAD(P)-dependent oxidoreductase, partial [Acidimicrobiia bacterium]